MLTFIEELLLLVLNEEEGSNVRVTETALAYALAGSVLLDLSFANRIDTEPETLRVVDRTPTGNLALDRVLAKIEARQEAADVGGWIHLLSVEDADIIREQALVRLVQRGVVSLRSSQFNWVFRARSHPTVDRVAERDVKERIAGALLSDDLPAPRDVALIGLVDACGILGDVFPDLGMEHCRARVALLRKMELVNRELAAAIADIEHGLKVVRDEGV